MTDVLTMRAVRVTLVMLPKKRDMIPREVKAMAPAVPDPGHRASNTSYII